MTVEQEGQREPPRVYYVNVPYKRESMPYWSLRPIRAHFPRFFIVWGDRIIVGEVRGAETIDMLQAMNTGHEGSLSTGHGNSVSDMLDRLETMVLLGSDIPLIAARRQIASAIDVMVQLGRLRDGRRCVLEISEIPGYRDGEIEKNPLFVYEEGDENVSGVLMRTGRKFVQQTKLKRAGKKEWETKENEYKTKTIISGNSDEQNLVDGMVVL